MGRLRMVARGVVAGPHTSCPPSALPRAWPTQRTPNGSTQSACEPHRGTRRMEGGSQRTSMQACAPLRGLRASHLSPAQPNSTLQHSPRKSPHVFHLPIGHTVWLIRAAEGTPFHRPQASRAARPSPRSLPVSASLTVKDSSTGVEFNLAQNFWWVGGFGGTGGWVTNFRRAGQHARVDRSASGVARTARARDS